ncbi:MAG: hypothetical protein FWH20_04535 [Oscillospiraceae bacterium]|nr:hypothetical protein [Oscillospiraceae bacterium]
MNRIEIVGLFTAIERMCEKKDFEGIELLTKRVLSEAIYDKKPKVLPRNDEDVE